MAIFRSAAEVLDGAGRQLGSGTAYVHLPRGLERAQQGTGTVSLTDWQEGGGHPERLRLADGRELRIAVSRDALSDCSRHRILRFEASWPPAPATP